jgi:hypothetical protein
MRIRFERSGGFTNIPVKGSFDLDDLPAEQAGALQDLVEKANFFALPEQISAGRPIPDQFTYQITVETGARRHTVVTGDRSAPETLRPLIQKLTELARTQGKK